MTHNKMLNYNNNNAFAVRKGIIVYSQKKLQHYCFFYQLNIVLLKPR